MSRLVPLLFASLLACGDSGAMSADGSPRDARDDARPVVVASVPPLAGFVSALLGDDVRVASLVPSGADPHVYEPSSSRLADVERAELLVVVGHRGFAFEQTWLPALREARPDLAVVRATDALSAAAAVAGVDTGAGAGHGREHDDDDPHVWTAPSDARAVVAHFAAAFSARWPERAADIASRARALDARLTAADDRLGAALVGSRGQAFVAMHAAWGRLARSHDLLQLALTHDHGEPSPLELAQLVERARAAGARLVLHPPWSDPRPAELLAQAIGGRVLAVDPMQADWEAALATFTAAFVDESAAAQATEAASTSGAAHADPVEPGGPR